MNRFLITFLTMVVFIVPAGIASATSVAGGELVFKGGQTGTEVYSDIRDAKANSKLYKVWAAVKVCTSTYSSGWKDDVATKRADREWYCNESSHYDYYQRN